MLDNKIIITIADRAHQCNISIWYCFILLYKFYNFVISSGLLLFVFGVDLEVAFCRLSHTSLFHFRQIR